MDWSSLPSDIRKLSDELARETATRATAEALKQQDVRFRHLWARNRSLSTESIGIPVPVPRNKGLLPAGCATEGAFFRFTFQVTEDQNFLPKQADYQMCVVGALDLDGSAVQLEDHWRVDTHLYPILPAVEELNEGEDAEKANEAQRVPNEPHALFHFQRGGFAQDEFTSAAYFIPGAALPPKQDDTWRALMQSPGPRVPHLPMCPVIAIDYAIGQHDGHLLHRLRARPEYLKVIQDAQERLWPPFVQSLSSYEGLRGWLGELVA